MRLAWRNLLHDRIRLLVTVAGLYGAAGSLIISALVQILGSLWILRKAKREVFW